MNDSDWEKQFAALAQSSGMTSLPEEMRERLAEAFRNHHAARPSLLQRLVATLSFDIFTELQPLGARDSQLLETRQLFYTCPLGDIAIDCKTEGDQIAVSGQLFLDTRQSPLTLTVTRDQEVIATTSIGPSNDFRLTIPAGVADLQLFNDSRAVILQAVPLELARG